jgi:hypothetical protein
MMKDTIEANGKMETSIVTFGGCGVRLVIILEK